MIDVFIPATIKDLNKLDLVVQSILKFVKEPIGDFYVSMPNIMDLSPVQKLKDFNGVEHRLEFHNDLDVLSTIDLRKSKFRPNWVLQQLLKLCQTLTKTEDIFICDSDIVFVRDFKLFDGDRPIQYLGHDDNEYYMNFNRKFSNNDFGRVTSDSYIADLGLWKKSVLDEMFAKYNMTREQFNDFTLENVHYDGTQEGSCIISEYELYGNYCAKFHPELYCSRMFNELDCGKPQNSQRQQIFTRNEMLNLIASADTSKYDAVKLQSSCFPSDIGYRKTKAQ